MRVPFLFGVVALICIGCSPIPTSVSHDYSVQKKMAAANHWQVLALDLANKINNELIRNDFLNVAVYVKETCGSDAAPCGQNETTQFDEGFRDLLVTQLVNYGIPTKTEIDRDVIVVDYKVQLVRNSKGRVVKPQPGMATLLTSVIYVFRNAPSEMVALSLAGIYDYTNYTSTMASNYEVIITTSMVSKKKYIFRSSDIYYINDRDFWHYHHFKNKSKTIQLTGAEPQESKSVDMVIPAIPQSPPPQSLQDI